MTHAENTTPPTRDPVTPETTDGPAAGVVSHDLALPAPLAEALSKDWDPMPQMPHPAHERAGAAAAEHRTRLSAELGGRAAVVPAGRLVTRANDTEYAFRPDSTFSWLTGESAAEAVLVMDPRAGGGHEATLFIREFEGPGTPAYFTNRLYGAVWVGGVPGVADTETRLGVRTASLAELPRTLARLGPDAVVLRGVDATVDELLPAAGSDGPDLRRVTDELRLVKDEFEISRLQAACDATARGFADVARELPAVLASGGVRGERWLEGTFWRRARHEGNEVGYTSIVAAGVHGTTLHWWRNDGTISPGQLLLADMGVETDELYTADVTRTFPVDGAWTPDQLEVYRAVQEAQEAGIAEVRAGNDFLAANRACHWVLADRLHRWGILDVTADVSLSEDPETPGAGRHRRYTLHSVSHMLGIDVHDCATARDDTYREGTLAAGMALTVEPGLYFQVNDRTVPDRFKGLAVRIEDDIVVTDGDPVNLSAGLPRDPDEIVAWLRESQASKPLG